MTLHVTPVLEAEKTLGNLGTRLRSWYRLVRNLENLSGKASYSPKYRWPYGDAESHA